MTASRNDIGATLLDVMTATLAGLAFLEVIKDIAALVIVGLTLIMTIHRFRKTFKKKNEKNVNNSSDNIGSDSALNNTKPKV